METPRTSRRLSRLHEAMFDAEEFAATTPRETARYCEADSGPRSYRVAEVEVISEVPAQAQSEQVRVPRSVLTPDCASLPVLQEHAAAYTGRSLSGTQISHGPTGRFYGGLVHGADDSLDAVGSDLLT